MNTQEYPYKAWVLTASFKPIEVCLVADVLNDGVDYGDQTDTGKVFKHADLFDTKYAAIAFGWEKLKAMAEALNKKQLFINKKSIRLNKASNE
jgi:hypothetical protein